MILAILVEVKLIWSLSWFDLREGKACLKEVHSKIFVTLIEVNIA